MKKQFVSDLLFGDAVSDVFAVKYRHPPREYKNGFFFEVGLADRTGDIALTYWGGIDRNQVQSIYDSFKEDDVVFVNGAVSEYRGAIRLDVNEGKGKISKVASYEAADFVPRTESDTNALLAEITAEMDAMQDPHLKALLNSFFRDSAFVKGFTLSPGAMSIHHACIGGLLEHTSHVLKICCRLYEIYPSMDRDLLAAGAILHDIGKMKEFRVTTTIRQSEEGMLRGHIILGEEMVLDRIGKIPDFPETLKMKLAHVLLTHHGEPEHGSPKRPTFPEAVAVHYADEVDAQVEQYVRLKEEADTEDFRTYSKRLGEIYLK